MVECNLAKVDVAGSSPVSRSNSLRFCESNSVVECNLAKVDVAGSSPVSRSNSLRFCESNSVVECNLAKVDVAGSSPVSRFCRLFTGFFFKLLFCAGSSVG